MSPEMNKFVEDAAKIRTSGRWAVMNEQIGDLAKNSGKDNEWQVQLLGGLCFQVFNEYLRLQEARVAARTDTSLLAWRARNLLELSVWATYFGRSRENAWRLYQDAGRDAKNLLDVFEQSGRAINPQADWLSVIADGKTDLSRRAATEGIETLEERYLRVEDAAGECGLEHMVKTPNKLLSKFVHPTAMQIVGIADKAKQILQRDMFYGLGCLFFVGAFTALEKSVLYIRPQGE